MQSLRLGICWMIIFVMSCSRENPLVILDIKQDDKPCSLLPNGWITESPNLVWAEEEGDIVPIDDPLFTPIGDYQRPVPPRERVVALQLHDQIYLYPHRILDRHEIVNQQDFPTLTFCPLAGTALAWENSQPSRFEVSGYLYNSNLMVRERGTDNIYNQMRSQGFTGDDACNQKSPIALMEAHWSFWLQNAPNALVLDPDRSVAYDNAPFSSTVQLNNQLFFPVDKQSKELQNYQLGYGLVRDQSIKFYPYTLFAGSKGYTDFWDAPVYVTGNAEQGWVTAYYHMDQEGTVVNLNLQRDGKSYRLRDQLSHREWDIWGHSLDGSAALKIPHGFSGYWYAFYAMFDQVEIYQEDED